MVHIKRNFFSDKELGRVGMLSTDTVPDDYADCFNRNRIPHVSVNKLFLDKLTSLVKETNTALYQYDLGDSISFERHLIGDYSEGDECTLHHDIWDTMHFDQDIVRKLSVVICLENNAVGGELQFFYTKTKHKLGLEDLELQESYTLQPGDAVIFPSYIYHQVTPIQSGTRKTMLALVTGPKFK